MQIIQMGIASKACAHSELKPFGTGCRRTLALSVLRNIQYLREINPASVHTTSSQPERTSQTKQRQDTLNEGLDLYAVLLLVAV